MLGADPRIVVEPPFRDPGATAIRHRAGTSWSGASGCAAPGGIPVKNRRWARAYRPSGPVPEAIGAVGATRNSSLLINPNSLPRANFSADKAVNCVK